MGIFSRNSVDKDNENYGENKAINTGSASDSEPIPDRATGKIMKLNKSEEGGGYGFISTKDIPFTRVFFHWSGLVPDTLPFLEMEEGMHVEFKPIKWNDGRWRAIKVRVIDSSESNE